MQTQTITTPSVRGVKNNYTGASARNENIRALRRYMTEHEAAAARHLSRLFLVFGRIEYAARKKTRNDDLDLLNDNVDLTKLKLSEDDAADVRELRTIKAWCDPSMWSAVEIMFNQIRIDCTDPKRVLTSLGDHAASAHFDNMTANGSDEGQALTESAHNRKLIGIGAMRATIWGVRRILVTYRNLLVSEQIAKLKKSDQFVDRRAAQAMCSPLQMRVTEARKKTR